MAGSGGVRGKGQKGGEGRKGVGKVVRLKQLFSRLLNSGIEFAKETRIREAKHGWRKVVGSVSLNG